MSSVRAFQVDTFTSQPSGGNPAGVILDADGLSMAQMRSLATRLGCADCAFALRPDGEDHDLRVRFLTPRGEAGFVGHATLAVHGVLASTGQPPRPRQKQTNGIVQIDVIVGASPPRIAIHLPPPKLLRAVDARQLAEVLAALSLSSSQLDPRCPPMIAGESGPRLLLAVDQASTLARLAPDLTRLAELSAQLDVPGYFLFTLRPAVADVYTEARMFCPALGIAEDPVSGNAHALLGAYLLRQGLITPRPAATDTDAATDADTIAFTGAQGHYLNRPGRVTVALTLAGSSLESVSIVGEAVVASSTTLAY